jgi:hypothetical protein
MSVPFQLSEPSLRVVQPAQQLGEGGLAGTVLAHDDEHLAGADVEVDVVQHSAVRDGVRERHAADDEAVGRGGVVGGSRGLEYGRATCRFGFAADEIGLQVEQPVDRAGREGDLVQVGAVTDDDEQAAPHLEDDAGVQREITQAEPPARRHHHDEHVREADTESAHQRPREDPGGAFPPDPLHVVERGMEKVAPTGEQQRLQARGGGCGMRDVERADSHPSHLPENASGGNHGTSKRESASHFGAA